MKTENNHQLELFSQSRSYGSQKRSPGKPFFTYIRGYEKMILIVIGFFATGLVSFSLGVENGKKVAIVKNDFAPAAKEAITEEKPVNNVMPLNILPEPEKAAVVIKKEIAREMPAPKNAVGAYTVQVASYKKKTDAQKEAVTLKKKGLVTLVLLKGNYHVLCVGNFSNKETAKQLVLELQKRYRSCYIRRL